MTPDFTPQTEIVNESERHATLFDTTELRDGICQRSRRIHSTLRCNFNLRTFPFDRQELPLEISDDEFAVNDVIYADRAQPLGFDGRHAGSRGGVGGRGRADVSPRSPLVRVGERRPPSTTTRRSGSPYVGTWCTI